MARHGAACAVFLLLAAAAAALALDCVETPTDPSCAAFTLPRAQTVKDLNNLCSAMHFMTGCSLYKACNATTRENVGSDPTICSPFQQLATICSKDPGMGLMSGCRANYNKICVNGSKVAQCKDQPGFGLMSTEDANKWVRSICEEMDMEGCERCTPAWKEGKKYGGPNCDPFAVYGWLCVQMPDMWQCKGRGRWDDICARDPKLYVCVGDAPALTDKGWWRPGKPPPTPAPTPDPKPRPAPAPDAPGGDSGGDAPYQPGPSMRMYFFNQMPFWLLFREWTPRTTAELAGAWFAIFFMGVFYELLQTIKYKIEAAWSAADAKTHVSSAPIAPDGACPCDEPVTLVTAGGVTPSNGLHHRTAAGAGAGPLGEGTESSCCSGARMTAPEASHLTVPLAPGLGDGANHFDQERPPHSNGGGLSGLTGKGAAAGPAPGVYGSSGGGGIHDRLTSPSWVAAQRRPGGLLDGSLFARDVARAVMAFVTTAVSYLLMLAAMSFHIGIFFAVCAGVAVGTGIFGRYRSQLAMAQQRDGCCG